VELIRDQWASEYNFWPERNSYGGPKAQKLLFHSLQSAFLGVLLLVASWAVLVPESWSFSPFTLFLRLLFFPVCQVFFPSRPQKMNSSLLALFQHWFLEPNTMLKAALAGWSRHRSRISTELYSPSSCSPLLFC